MKRLMSQSPAGSQLDSDGKTGPARFSVSKDVAIPRRVSARFRRHDDRDGGLAGI